MLIKYYSYLPNNNNGHAPVSADLTIIEKCENVIVHGGVYSLNDTGPESHTQIAFMFLDVFDYVLQDSAPCKLITFYKDGQLTRLAVYGTAYVCNNDGETIEKVSLS